jgi:hypothetical protein
MVVPGIHIMAGNPDPMAVREVNDSVSGGGRSRRRKTSEAQESSEKEKQMVFHEE